MDNDTCSVTENSSTYNVTNLKQLYNNQFTNKTRKTCYVPHRFLSPRKVDRRNARERARSNKIVKEFQRLRRLLPFKKTRVPKEDILRLAVQYIRHLESMIEIHDAQSFALNEAGSQEAVEGYVTDHEDMQAQKVQSACVIIVSVVSFES